MCLQGCVVCRVYICLQPLPTTPLMEWSRLTLLMISTTGISTKVTTVSLQLAWNMKNSTTAAWVALRMKILRFRHTWSLTVLVSVDNLLIISPTRNEGGRGEGEQDEPYY